MQFFTEGPVDPSQTERRPFTAPVDAACELSTETLRFSSEPAEVRAPDGTRLGGIDPPESDTFPAGEYLLELHTPVKIYLHVESQVAIDIDSKTARLEFGEKTTVTVGARSHHSSPEATITVPDDPEAMMKAVSAFSSSLKTTSAERAWPSLRGHPPVVERGEELHIPDELDPPQTGVTIRIPPEYGYVYTVAPLAYYLGAQVVPDETAYLTTDTGIYWRLGSTVAELADHVETLLKRTLVLDCVTRTEGLYPDDLYERSVVEQRIELDFEALYDASLAERLEAYLAIPADVLAEVTPTWHRVTHVQPTPESVELLPYVLNDLSLVRSKDPTQPPSQPSEAQEQTGEILGAFKRTSDGEESESGNRTAPDDAPQSSALTRFMQESDEQGDDEGATGERDGDAGTTGEQEVSSGDDTPTLGVPGEDGYMPLPDVDALEQAWIGDETPIHGTKLLPEAFANSVSSESDAVEIVVVCNDGQMREELDTAAAVYDKRSDIRVNVEYEFGVSTDELRALLADSSDMFHFIGHIDGRGFECPDGVFDAATVESTGATMVLLNGCRSHDQGTELVQAGARAAVVSLGDLWNSGAGEVGETFARLLSHGFTVGSALEIVREYTSIGREYVALGDPGVRVTQNDNGTPTVHHLDVGDDPRTVTVERRNYWTRVLGAGSITRAKIDEMQQYHLTMGDYGAIRLEREALRDALEPYGEPLVVDGELRWSDEWFAES
ncbi:CHAT domain-containing protein [Halorussus halophilus]|uniref:CHAT domain-containing protein n=1 Tax=Halorussus halophilus TaxID=2650975 RepID=UPI001CE3EC87|nr:CHAT domain-containing protein [Halorussus halophilus]